MELSRKPQYTADEIYELGIALVGQYLDREKACGKISSYQYMPDLAATIKPFDYTVQDCDGDIKLIRVDTTQFGFSSPMYIYDCEAEFAKYHAESYQLYRVCDAVAAPKLRICDNIAGVLGAAWDELAEVRTRVSETNPGLGILSVRWILDPMDDADLHFGPAQDLSSYCSAVTVD